MSSWEEAYDAVLASNVLGTSRRQQNLLKYLLEKNALGESEQISAYAIAIDIFERPQDFDPQIDSIVRAEMSRLRKNLKVFNGGANPFVIELPKGGFLIHVNEKLTDTPHIPKKPHPKKTAKSNFILLGAAAVFIIMLLAFTFISKTGLKNSQDISDNCSIYYPNVKLDYDPMIRNQSDEHKQYVEVIKAAIIQSLGVKHISSTDLCPETAQIYILSVSMVDRNNMTNISLRAKEEQSGLLLASTSVDISSSESGAFEKVAQLTDNFVNPIGFIAQHVLKSQSPNSPMKSNVVCIAGMYDYWSNDAANLFAPTYSCMEDLIKKKTASAAQYMLLGKAILNANVDIVEMPDHWTVEYAENHIKTAQELSPDDNFILYYSLHIEFTKKNPDLEIMRHMVFLLEKKYSYNSEFMMLIAHVEGYFLENWDKALVYAERARNLSGYQDNSHYEIEVIHNSLYGSFTNIGTECFNRFSKQNLTWYAVIDLMCSIKSGDSEKIESSVAHLTSLGLTNKHQAIEFVGNYRIGQQLKNDVILKLKTIADY